jgi:uncharacterized membrane protein
VTERPRFHGRPSGPVARNIATIAKIEQEEHESQRAIDRIAEVVSRFAGSVWFLVVHVIWFGGWIGANVAMAKPIDPYPFTFLTLLVSLEAIFLSAFILISQNHSERLAEQRAHLDLQINLLAEEEMTKVLQGLAAIVRHLGIKGVLDDPDTRQLAATDIEEVAEAVTEAEPGKSK